MSATVERQSNRDKLGAAVLSLVSRHVLVGIPAGSTRPGETITNAAIGYIHEFGAPEANIPPRPWLIPGFELIKDDIKPLLHNAAKLALTGDVDSVNAILEQIGMMARDAIKKHITDGLDPPLSPNTVRKSDKGLGSAELAMRKPLIDTADFLNSITYIVEDNTGGGSFVPTKREVTKV